MAVDTKTFRHVLGHFCSGVVIVTGTGDGEPAGLSAQSFTALSLEPPMVLFCVARTSTSWPRFRDSGRFRVHVLGKHQEELCRRFAVSGGPKFADVDWAWDDKGNPTIAGCSAYVDCRLKTVYDEGDHHIVIGHVDDAHLGNSSEPLLFYQGAFRRLLSLEPAT